MKQEKKQATKEKFYNCSECEKACIPAAFIKRKGEKEKCYCKRCLKKLFNPTEF